MKNFEVQHTVRLYDTELIAEIGRTYEAHANEYRNKNEFLTQLLRLGIKAMNALPPKSPAESSVPPVAFQKLLEAVGNVKEITKETAEFLTLCYKRVAVHLEVIENLLSSSYNMQLGELSGKPLLPRKVEDGFFDDLPFRFQNLILKLEKKYGLTNEA